MRFYGEYLPVEERLRLIPMDGGEAESYIVSRWRNHPAIRIGFVEQRVVTPDMHARFVETKEPNQLFWIVEVADEPVGTVSLDVNVEYHTAELGRFLIAPEHQGKGLGQRALRLALRYAFEWLGLRKVWVKVKDANAAASHVYEKAGFEKHDVRFGMMWMGLTREEWEKRQ